jgi:hypothetical protein
LGEPCRSEQGHTERISSVVSTPHGATGLGVGQLWTRTPRYRQRAWAGALHAGASLAGPGERGRRERIAHAARAGGARRAGPAGLGRPRPDAARGGGRESTGRRRPGDPREMEAAAAPAAACEELGASRARAAVCQARAGAAPALSIGPVPLPVAGREPRAAWGGIPRGRLSRGSGTGFACPTFGVKRAESVGPAGRLGPALGPGLQGAGCACARPPVRAPPVRA